MPNKGTFQKGKSGNPGGRPKALADVMEMARARTKTNLDRLIELSVQDEDLGVACKATIALHEIAWGKPSQSVGMTGTVGLMVEGRGRLMDMIRKDARKP